MKKSKKSGTKTNESLEVNNNTMANTTRKKRNKLFVSLVKGVNGLGFSITATTRDIQAGGVALIYIKNILPKGAAIENGQLRPGDRLLEVNQKSMDGKSQSEVKAILRNTPQQGEVNLMVSRQENVEEIVIELVKEIVKERTGRATPSHQPSSPETTAPNTEESEEYNSISPDVSVNSNGEVIFPWKHREILNLDIPVHDTERAVLGVSVKGKTTGGEAKGIVYQGIFVNSVNHGGAASKDGRLKTNDQLVNINGIALLGKANCDAMDTLRRAMHEEGPTPGVITLTVARRLVVGTQQEVAATVRDLVTSMLTSSAGNESYREYRISANNNTTSSMDSSHNVEKPDTVKQFKSPTVLQVGGETIMIEQYADSVRKHGRPHSPDGCERLDQTSKSDSDAIPTDAAYASRTSLEEQVAGFARDQLGRQSMQESEEEINLEECNSDESGCNSDSAEESSSSESEVEKRKRNHAKDDILKYGWRAASRKLGLRSKTASKKTGRKGKVEVEGKHWKQSFKEEVLKYTKQQKSWKDAGDKFGVHPSTVKSWGVKVGLKLKVEYKEGFKKKAARFGEKNGWTAAGKKFGVSDVTARNWANTVPKSVVEGKWVLNPMFGYESKEEEVESEH